MIDWDAYRAAYPTMSYPDLVEFHSRVWAAFPDQDYHSHDLVASFFANGEARNVIEIGGWRGEAAATTLAHHSEILRWDNFEVCAEAVAASVPTDQRYSATAPDRWPWEIALEGGYDTAVLAHVIEHMLARQLAQLVDWLTAAGVRRMYVESPIRNTPLAWRHSTSAHVLEWGWDQVIAFLSNRGFVVTGRWDERPERTVIFVERP